MKASFFSTSFIRSSLPLLEECYGFDATEISTELGSIITKHTQNNSIDNELLETCKTENNTYDAMTYGLKSDDEISIPVTDDFGKQYLAIENLCQQFHLTDKQSGAILLFMAAIFNRNLNDLSLNSEVQDMEQENKWNARIVRPDLLKPFIALHQEEMCDAKGNLRTAVPIKIGYKNRSFEIINNKGWWLTRIMKEYLRQKLGDITIESAQEELFLFYNEEKGRKSANPYLNYIIHGTYNFVRTIFPNDKVTVEQCRFLLQYLQAIGQIKEHDKLNNINNLQSHVKALMSSQSTPVQRHLKAKKYKSLPLYQRIMLY